MQDMNEDLLRICRIRKAELDDDGVQERLVHSFELFPAKSELWLIRVGRSVLVYLEVLAPVRYTIRV